jgi:hypothetical protein
LTAAEDECYCLVVAEWFGLNGGDAGGWRADYATDATDGQFFYRRPAPGVATHNGWRFWSFGVGDLA